jgi:hypothetical protein
MKLIRALYVLAALYDGVLGVAFLFAPGKVFALFGVTPPNHFAYVQFPALLLLVFSALFLQISLNPIENRALIPYGMGLKVSYVGTVFFYSITKGIPHMWIPWAWADLAFLVLFALTFFHLSSAKNAQAEIAQ